jgi:REP element-mobilizing transposase RayT
MRYNPNIHHRKSIRLKGYDYSQSGSYFVTICVQNRKCLFGAIENNEFAYDNAGIMVETVWNEMPQFYKGIELGTFVVMPNHIHGIINIVGATPCGCPNDYIPNQLSLSDIVHRFKTMTTKRYADNVKSNNWKPYEKRLWQRNYYEHIIHDDTQYTQISKYIQNNPKTWEDDKLWNN